MMRSNKLGYNAPIEVYQQKYYRYSVKDYSIMNMPMSQNDYEVMKEAVDMLRQLEGFEQFKEISDIISRLQDNLAVKQDNRKPIINFDSVPNLKGIRMLNPLYNYIAHKQTLRIMYQPFSARRPMEYIFYPYHLKEFRNRWFLFGSRAKDMVLYNFVLDRIISVEPIDIPYVENKKFDSTVFFDDVIGVSKNIDDKPLTVIFWSSAKQSKYITTKPIHSSQQLIKRNSDGSCYFRIDVVINKEMYSTFMSYGPGVKVVSPRYAQKYMKDKLTEALQQYERQENFKQKEDK